MTLPKVVATFVAGVVAGALIGWILVPSAHAATTTVNTLQIVDSTYIANGSTVYKMYDNNNGAVCYVLVSSWSSEGPAASCFKN